MPTITVSADKNTGQFDVAVDGVAIANPDSVSISRYQGYGDDEPTLSFSVYTAHREDGVTTRQCVSAAAAPAVSPTAASLAYFATMIGGETS